MRGLLSIVVGILVGFLVMIAIALVGGLLFPGSARVDGFRTDAIAAAFPSLPMGAKIAIVLSWFGGPLAGASAAKRIAGQAWAAWTIAGLFAVYVLLNVMILPMPGWLQGIAVAAPLIGGLIGNHLVDERGDARA